MDRRVTLPVQSDTTVQICLTVQICGHSPTRDNQVLNCIHIKDYLAVPELNINVDTKALDQV